MRKTRFAKPAILLVSVILVLCLAVGGTFAYIIATDDPVSTTFLPIVVEGRLNESNSTYTVTSESNVNVYVRVRITPNWIKDGIVFNDPAITAADFTVRFDSAYWTQVGDFYYYNWEITPGERTSGLTLVQNTTEPEGCEFAADVEAEVIQSQSAEVVNDTWGYVPGDN